MMAGNTNSGGYKKPSNPAPVSGPGALSQRTDGGPTQAAKYMPGLEQGQGQVNMANQLAAPLAGTESPVNTASLMPPLPPLIPLTEKTQRPQEDISLGMPFGNTPGPEILNLPNATQTQYVNAKSVIDDVANAPDASPMMKYLSQRTGQVF
jgi:hypothetical protein